MSTCRRGRRRENHFTSWSNLSGATKIVRTLHEEQRVAVSVTRRRFLMGEAKLKSKWSVRKKTSKPTVLYCIPIGVLSIARERCERSTLSSLHQYPRRHRGGEPNSCRTLTDLLRCPLIIGSLILRTPHSSVKFKDKPQP